MTCYTCPNHLIAFHDLQPCYRFASSIALFGGLLKNSPFMKQADWKEVIEMAQQSGDPEDGMQQEFIGLIEKARKIYGKSRQQLDRRGSCQCGRTDVKSSEVEHFPYFIEKASFVLVRLGLEVR